MTTTECRHCDELSAAVEAAHEHALRVLTDTGRSDLEAVSWLAAHLAAVEDVIDGLLRRHSVASSVELREQQAANRRLQHELRVFEQALAGDALAARIDLAGCRSRVVDALAAHALGEHLLLDRLGRTIGAEATVVAAGRYRRALAAGPTRPHPHLPSRLPVVGCLARRAARVRDHVLDVLDGRHNPLPRPRRPHGEPGRWGHYLLGTPLHGDDSAGDARVSRSLGVMEGSPSGRWRRS